MQYVLQKNKAQNTNNSDSVRKAERILRLEIKMLRFLYGKFAYMDVCIYDYTRH